MATLTDASLICSEGREIEELDDSELSEDLVTEIDWLEELSEDWLDFVTLTLTLGMRMILS